MPVNSVIKRKLTDAFFLLHADEAQAAAQRMRDLFAKYPDHPVVRQNFATIIAHAGCHDEALEVQRSTVDMFPQYIIGRTSLMLHLVKRGLTEEANELNSGFELPEQMERDNYAGYVAAQAILCMSNEPPNFYAALKAINMAEELSPNNTVVRLAKEEFAKRNN